MVRTSNAIPIIAGSLAARFEPFAESLRPLRAKLVPERNRAEVAMVVGLCVALILGCQTPSPQAGANAGGARQGVNESGTPSVIPSVSGISLQADKDAVLHALGQPAEERPQVYDTSRYDYGEMITMAYPGLRLHLVGGVYRRGPFRVLEIEIFDPLWTVTPRLYVGMAIDEAQRSLPGLRKIVDARRPGQNLMSYAFPVPGTQAGGQLILRVDRQKVLQVTLTSDLD